MLSAREEVILVDHDDREIGRAEKLQAHRLGAMHRAISVCVNDSNGRMLLQRRAAGKYHSAGLWTNACCTHPRPGEPVQEAAERRLREELGVSCPLRWTLRTHYLAQVSPELIENEVVHLFVGSHAGQIRPNPAEVEEHAWQTYKAVLANIESDPDAFTYWFKYYVSAFGEEIFRLS
jgi:isopentenyl-diphosphate delta-isomerase